MICIPGMLCPSMSGRNRMFSPVFVTPYVLSVSLLFCSSCLLSLGLVLSLRHYVTFALAELLYSSLFYRCV